MKFENYDITKLTNNEKSDFKNTFKNIENYINQKFNYCEYINILEELKLTDYIAEREKESDNKYRNFLDEHLHDLKNELINNYLNIYKKHDLKISYENISDDYELHNEIYLYNKLYKNNKKSYRNITDEFNEMGNFTFNDEDNKK